MPLSPPSGCIWDCSSREITWVSNKTQSRKGFEVLKLKSGCPISYSSEEFMPLLERSFLDISLSVNYSLYKQTTVSNCYLCGSQCAQSCADNICLPQTNLPDVWAQHSDPLFKCPFLLPTVLPIISPLTRFQVRFFFFPPRWLLSRMYGISDVTLRPQPSYTYVGVTAAAGAMLSTTQSH